MKTALWARNSVDFEGRARRSFALSLLPSDATMSNEINAVETID